MVYSLNLVYLEGSSIKEGFSGMEVVLKTEDIFFSFSDQILDTMESSVVSISFSFILFLQNVSITSIPSSVKRHGKRCDWSRSISMLFVVSDCVSRAAEKTSDSAS